MSIFRGMERLVERGRQMMRRTLRSIISRFFVASSVLEGSSSLASAGLEPSGGGGLSAVFGAVSVDCHRRTSCGDDILKTDGRIVRVSSCDLVLEAGVERDLEDVEEMKVRLCRSSARRSMILSQYVQGVGQGRRTLTNGRISSPKFLDIRGVMDLGGS